MLSRRHVTRLTPSSIDQSAGANDCALQVAPAAPNLDLCLINVTAPDRAFTPPLGLDEAWVELRNPVPAWRSLGLCNPRLSVCWRSAMIQRRISPLGLLFTLLALMAQLGSGAVVPRMEVMTALGDVTAICHADETSDQAPPVPHHPADCPICPLCVSLSAAAFAIMADPVLPTPRLVIVAPAVILPPATAPPATLVLAARPRGPPALLT